MSPFNFAPNLTQLMLANKYAITCKQIQVLSWIVGLRMSMNTVLIIANNKDILFVLMGERIAVHLPHI